MQTGTNSRPEEAFLTAFSHEVRGALTLLTGALGLLQTTELSCQQQELTRKMERASDFLLNLSTNLLDLGRIREGKTELYPTMFPLGDLLDDLDLLFQDKVQEKGLHWSCIRDCPADLSLTTDRTRLMQILTNLLSNACKFTEEGFIHLKASVITLQGDEWICFEVRDTGVGISPEEQENLFQEFYQAGSFFHRQLGTGLGLHIAKKLSLAISGDLSLISQPGKGSCFSLHIPISLQQALANPA